MAIIRRGILGGFSGKVANVVGSSWKGIAVMRALPLSVNNPRTAGQVVQRSAFSTTAKFASSILTQWIKPLWDRTAQQMSGYNAFIQQNVDIVKNDGKLDIQNLIMSHGKLGENHGVFASVDDGDVSLSWNPSPAGSYQMSTDKMFAILVSEDGTLLGSSQGIKERSEGSMTLEHTNNQEYSGDAYVVCAFARHDGTMVSFSDTFKVVV